MAPWNKVSDALATDEGRDSRYTLGSVGPADVVAVLVAARLAAVRVEDTLTARLRSGGLPRSWHEAWLDTADTPGRSNVPDLTAGKWPTSCGDRHEWHLATDLGARRTTTWCTRPAFHTGRHAQGQLVDGGDGTVLRGRVIAVWEDAP